MNEEQSYNFALFTDELEALKLYNISGLSQAEVAEKMSISQSRVSRLLKSINKKMAKILLEDEATVSIKKNPTEGDQEKE